MNGRERRAIGVALAVLCGAGAAQAQDVHKCTVNGAVTYQSTPCPASDVVLPAAPTPSDQESRQARVDLSRQRMQAASGRILHPIVAPPPPPPPPPVANVTTTTTIVMQGTGRSLTIRQTRTGPALPPARPLNNCEKLNQDNDEAQDRRAQLRAPSELASHDELLHKADADVARIAQLAAASNCHLKR